MRTLLFGLIVCACSKSDPDWEPQKIHEIKHGPFTIKIPAGWRSDTELKDPAARAAVPAGEHWITAQDLKHRSAMSSIQFQLRPKLGLVSCLGLEDQLKRDKDKSRVEAVRIEVAGHAGCKVTFTSNGTNSRAIITTVDGDLFKFDCVGNDDALDAACNEVFAQLKINYTPGPSTGAQATADKFAAAEIEMRQRVRECHRRTGEEPAVKIVYEIDVAADGGATPTTKSSNNQNVDNCAAARIAGTRFPTGNPVRFEQTFEW
jgi:hypothetical protein